MGFCERGAVFNGAVVGVDAVFDGGFQYRLIPAIHKVAVEAEAGGIAVAEHEATAGTLGNGGDVVEDLVEEVDELAGVSWRTKAVVESRHVCDVGVVREVEIFAVPAGLKMDLCAEAEGAANGCGKGVGLSGGFVIETGEGDAVGLRTGGEGEQSLVVVRAGGGGAGEHAESRGKGHDGGACIATAEVVDSHAGVGHDLKSAVRMGIVELRCPVGGFVILDRAGGAGGGHEVGWGRGNVDVCGSKSAW